MNKDYILRILKTFGEGCLGYVLVALASGVDFTSKEAVKTFAVGVISAGFSAIFNYNKAKKPVESIFEEVPEDNYITEDER